MGGGRFWRRWQPMSDADYQREKDRLLEKVPVPVFWMFGKTGSGKTSIIRFLTGAPDAEIGNGFQPKTLYWRQYDFPSSEQPLVRFLDTRGLGEWTYDPSEDLDRFDRMAHVMIVSVRLTDTALDPILQPLRRIRQGHRSRPVVLALTCLHQAYPGRQHPPWEMLAGHGGAPPPEVGEHWERQRRAFDGLVDRIVPIDLTRVEDGFDDPDFGGGHLQRVLWELLPGAYRQTFLQLEEEIRPLKDLNQRRAMPLVLSCSLLAATAGAVPVPWVDPPLVAAIQSRMVRRLQRIYDQPSDPRFVGSFLGAQSGQMLTRLALRSWLKLVPLVGAAASAALAYTSTYALGKVCCWYFGQVRQGNAPSEADVRRVWHEQLALAGARWKGRDGNIASRR